MILFVLQISNTYSYTRLYFSKIQGTLLRSIWERKGAHLPLTTYLPSYIPEGVPKQIACTQCRGLLSRASAALRQQASCQRTSELPRGSGRRPAAPGPVFKEWVGAVDREEMYGAGVRKNVVGLREQQR